MWAVREWLTTSLWLENRKAFARIELLPRVLADVSHVDTRITLFGKQHEFPILLAPTGYHKLAHPQGELETVRGANLMVPPWSLPSFSTVSFAEMSSAAEFPLCSRRTFSRTGHLQKT